jgi:hypothetical protein
MTLYDILVDTKDWVVDNYKTAIGFTAFGAAALWGGQQLLSDSFSYSNDAGKVEFSSDSPEKVSALLYFLEEKSPLGNSGAANVLVAVDDNRNFKISDVELQPHIDHVLKEVDARATERYGLAPNQ